MARHESDREDMVREATALVRRAELVVPGEPEPVVAGFRNNGWFSVYFGQDPAFTFDAMGGLRRGYSEGRLYRTQGTTLARLERRRTARTSELLRHDLTPAELNEFIAAMRTRLTTLHEHIARGDATMMRIVGEPVPFMAEIDGAMERILHRADPLAAAIPGRR